MDAGGNIALQTVAKPLQIAAWLLLTAYRNLPTPYPKAPSPTSTTYRLSAIHLCYRQTRDGRTDGRQSVSKESGPYKAHYRLKMLQQFSSDTGVCLRVVRAKVMHWGSISVRLSAPRTSGKQLSVRSTVVGGTRRRVPAMSAIWTANTGKRLRAKTPSCGKRGRVNHWRSYKWWSDQLVGWLLPYSGVFIRPNVCDVRSERKKVGYVTNAINAMNAINAKSRLRNKRMNAANATAKTQGQKRSLR